MVGRKYSVAYISASVDAPETSLRTQQLLGRVIELFDSPYSLKVHITEEPQEIDDRPLTRIAIYGDTDE